jgi:hypothetical protein
MECMLLPKNPTTPLTKVPLVDQVKYDGGGWLSYPQRWDKKWPKLEPDDILPLYQYMSSLPNSRDIEPFLQTWLFFGLLSEFFGGNALENSEGSLTATAEGSDKVTLNQVVWRIYDSYTYEDAGRPYITTATLLRDMEEAVKRSVSNREHFKISCLRFRECLRMAWKVLKAAPADFDPRIRASMGVVAEILSHSMNFAFLLSKLPITCPTKWTTTYFDKEPLRHDGSLSVRETMLKNGWCPSDIFRSTNTSILFRCFISWERWTDRSRLVIIGNVMMYIAQLIRSIKITKSVLWIRDVIVNWSNVNNSEIISILEEEESIPLLRFVGGIDGLKIEIVESFKNTPYVAISHVSHTAA